MQSSSIPKLCLDVAFTSRSPARVTVWQGCRAAADAVDADKIKEYGGAADFMLCHMKGGDDDQKQDAPRFLLLSCRWSTEQSISAARPM